MLRANEVAVEKSGRRWSLALGGALLALAVLLGGMALRAEALQVPEQKEKQKQDEPKKVRPPFNDMVLPPGLDLDELLQALGGTDEEQMLFLLKQMDRLNQEMRRALEQQGGRQGRMAPNPLGGLRMGRLPMRPTTPAGSPGRLGVRVAPPVEALVDQLDLPSGQGLVIAEVLPDSAAAKAGIKAHDILLEVNGKPVPSNQEEFVRQLADIKANQPVEAVVLRKGHKETLKGLSLPEGRVEPAQPELRFPVPNFNPPAGGPVQRGTSVSTTRNNDQFTSRQQQGDEVVSVSGRVADGKAIIEEVVVKQGDTTTKYDRLDKVPEAQRATAQKLADMVVKGNTRLELRQH
jgi:hypothetical protein